MVSNPLEVELHQRSDTMSDEQAVEQEEAEKASDESTEQVEPKVEEQPQEGTAETEEEASEEVVEGESEGGEEEQANPFLIRTKVDGEDREFDLSNEDTLKEVQETLSKGYGYTGKMQKLSESEKSNEAWINLGKSVANDPFFVKHSLAQQMNIDPSVLYANPQQPPEWLKTENPEQYADALAAYKQTMLSKQIIDQASESYTKQMAQTNNQMVLDKARLEHDMSEDEFRQVQNYVTTKIQPGQNGMYDASDVKSAFWALYGEKRAGQQRLDTSETIRKTIQTANREAGAGKSTPQRPERLTKKQKDDKAFTDFAKDMS